MGGVASTTASIALYVASHSGNSRLYLIDINHKAFFTPCLAALL